MDTKTEKLLQKLKGRKVGVFCDDSNLYHSYLKYGCRVDLKNMAWELRLCWHLYINRIRNEVELK